MISKLLGNPYVLGAIVLAFLGLAGFAGIQYYRAQAAVAEVDVVKGEKKAVEGERDRAVQKIKEGEITIAGLRRANELLDEAIKVRDARNKDLEAAKRNLKKELDAIKETLPKEDQDCLDRPLPDALSARLRSD